MTFMRYIKCRTVGPHIIINMVSFLMNGPRRTACFAKEMHSYTLFTLKLYLDMQREVMPEVQPEIIPEKQPEVVPEVVPEVRTRSGTGS